MSGNKVLCQNKECQKAIDPVKDFLCSNCGQVPIDQNLYPSIKEMLEFLLKLSERNKSIGEHVISLGFEVRDTRRQFLGFTDTLFRWTYLQLSLYYNNSQTPDSFIQQWLKKDISKLDDEGLKKFLLGFDLLNRMSFLTVLIFRMQILFEDIKNILPNKPTNNLKYNELVKHVLRELGMLEQDSELFRILNFPAIVRNCAHNNGVHAISDDNGWINGIHFTFKQGKDVNYYSWRHLYFFYDKIFNALEQIFENPIIKEKPCIN